MVRSDLKGATMARQREVADGAGVPWSTLRKIIDGDTQSPQYDTIKALWAWYEANPPKPKAAAEAASSQ